jgi:peptidyl-prolyl cis-trans isomerase SurA
VNSQAPPKRHLATEQEAMDEPMSKTPARKVAFRLRMAAAALVAATVTLIAARAEAQFVAVIVNGEPVTNYDIEQRSKLTQLSTRKIPPRKEVIEELIEERLKTQLLRRFQIPGIDKDVNNAFANMARRMRATPKQFTDNLAKSGVNADTLKARIKGEIVWNQIIRGRYQSSFQFNDKDILAKLEPQKSDATPTVAYDYTLRPIVFIVPRGSPPTAIAARRRDAEELRSRFQGCQEGIRYAYQLRDVAVRAPVRKSSAELAPALREILEKTEIGKLTAPEVTQQGVEVYALCGKKESAAEDAIDKNKVREKLFAEQFKLHSTQLMKELRSQAMIEFR